jgi:hypothetical protein
MARANVEESTRGHGPGENLAKLLSRSASKKDRTTSAIDRF